MLCIIICGIFITLIFKTTTLHTIRKKLNTIMIRVIKFNILVYWQFKSHWANHLYMVEKNWHFFAIMFLVIHTTDGDSKTTGGVQWQSTASLLLPTANLHSSIFLQIIKLCFTSSSATTDSATMVKIHFLWNQLHGADVLIYFYVYLL